MLSHLGRWSHLTESNCRPAHYEWYDYDQARAQEAWRYAPFFHSFLSSGVALPPSVYEVWFVSGAHGEAELEAIAAAAPAAAQAAAAAQPE